MPLHIAGWSLLTFVVLAMPANGLDNLDLTWSTISGALIHVSVGPAGTWGVDCDNKIHYRIGTYNNDGTKGTDWKLIDGTLKQIDVGKDICWGVNKNDSVYIRIGITKSKPAGCGWVLISGSLKHVSVSERGHVWGVNSKDQIYRRVGANLMTPEGDTWQNIAGSLKQVSVGGSGVWGVNVKDQIYYRSGTVGDPYTKGDKWIRVPGSLKYISSGECSVWGVNSKNALYRRVGLSHATPTGISWQLMNQKLTQVEIWQAALWGDDCELEKLFLVVVIVAPILFVFIVIFSVDFCLYRRYKKRNRLHRGMIGFSVDRSTVVLAAPSCEPLLSSQTDLVAAGAFGPTEMVPENDERPENVLAGRCGLAPNNNANPRYEDSRITYKVTLSDRCEMTIVGGCSELIGSPISQVTKL